MTLKPFAREQDLQRERAAHEVQPIAIPFKHSEFLKPQYSNGVTEYCFFLKSKTTGEVFPWNSHMAENGNVHYLPYFDLDELRNPTHAGTVSIWQNQGILPAGYSSAVPPAKEAPLAFPTKAILSKTVAASA